MLDVSLGERDDGSWAALEVGVIVPRQNGKNEILVARELAGIVLFDDDLITHSAHRADTTLEQFRKMEQLAEDFQEFGRLVRRVSRVNGHEAIELKGGRRIRFVSRQRNPGRGFSGSVVVLDEAFDLSPSAIGAMIPTLSTRQMAQVWYASSPPHHDSVVLHGVRRRGRNREGGRLAYFEWANEEGVEPTDRDAQYAVNPAMGRRISEDFIDAEWELMKAIPHEFMREIMGVAEELEGEDDDRVISAADWDACCSPDVAPEGTIAFGVDVNPERTWSAVVAADHDGRVELVAHDPGTDWVLPWLLERVDRWGKVVAVDPSGPAGGFIKDLDKKAKVVEVGGRELAQASAAFYDDVVTRKAQIRRHTALDGAVRAATRQSSGDAWRWGRKDVRADVTPLVAATIARWVAMHQKVRKTLRVASL